jgi:hypothetical protein
MFAQYLQHTAIRAEFVIDRDKLRHGTAFGRLEDGIQPVGVCFVGTKHAKVRQIHPENVAEKISKLARA